MNKLKILVVEDDKLNSKLVRTVLELDKYLVLEAKNAEEGIRSARDEGPDLILMDIRLPGMNGLEATRLIKTDPRTKEIPVIALTSLASAGTDIKMKQAGCSGCISKPFDIGEFREIIALYLRGGGTIPDNSPPGR